MSYKLWLDDQLNNPEALDRYVPEGYFGAISSQEAINCVKRYGVPEFISFDHDLGIVDGVEDSAMVFLKWLWQNHPDCEFEYEIHSANPIGAKNIESYIESWKKSKL